MNNKGIFFNLLISVLSIFSAIVIAAYTAYYNFKFGAKLSFYRIIEFSISGLIIISIIYKLVYLYIIEKKDLKDKVFYERVNVILAIVTIVLIFFKSIFLDRLDYLNIFNIEILLLFTLYLISFLTKVFKNDDVQNNLSNFNVLLLIISLVLTFNSLDFIRIRKFSSSTQPYSKPYLIITIIVLVSSLLLIIFNTVNKVINKKKGNYLFVIISNIIFFIFNTFIFLIYKDETVGFFLYINIMNEIKIILLTLIIIVTSIYLQVKEKNVISDNNLKDLDQNESINKLRKIKLAYENNLIDLPEFNRLREKLTADLKGDIYNEKK